MQAISQLLKNRDQLNFEAKKQKLEILFAQKVANGFNGNILIAQRDQIILEKSSGYSNFEEKIPNQSNTRFQLASLSKTFTAMAVLKLVEDGKLSLDLTVKDYFPSFPYEGISLRSLLSHRSGLPHYEYIYRSEKKFPDNQDLMNWFQTIKPTPPVSNLPDHYFSYNNSNFAILAAVVEKVSGKRFSEYLRADILLPLGMTKTLCANELTDSIPKVSFGYQNSRRIPKDQFDNILGDKGVYSTTHDLFKWYKAIKNSTLFSKVLLREAFTPRSFEFPGLRNYGYGFRLWLNNKQQTDYIYHTGWWKGYNSIMFFDLREDFVIILLSNRYDRSVYYIKEFIEVLHGDKKETTMEDNILDL